MGRYFGNTPQVGVGNAFLDAFNRSLAQAKQDRLVNRSIRMQDEDRASAKVMQGLQVQEQYPGTTILPTSYTGVGPGTLPNPVDQVQIGKVEPGQPLNVQSGPGLDFSVPGAVTDVGEKQRILTDRLQRSLTAAFAGAQATEAGKVAGNPLSVDLTRSEIGKNNAQAIKDGRVPAPVPSTADKINKRIQDLTAQGKPLAQASAQARLEYGEQNATPASEQGHFSITNGIDPNTGKPGIFRVNTRTGEVTATGVGAKDAPDKQPAPDERTSAAVLPSMFQAYQIMEKYSKPDAMSQIVRQYGTMARFLQTPEGRQLRQASDQFINGTALALEGQRFTPEKVQMLRSVYEADASDDPTTLAQKTNARRTQMRAALAKAGRGIDDIEKQFPGITAKIQNATASPDDQTPPTSGQARIDQMIRDGKSDAEIKAAIAAGGHE